MKIKKKLQQGFVVPLVITILAFLAIGAGIYAYHEKGIADKAVSQITNETKTATSTKKRILNTHRKNPIKSKTSTSTPSAETLDSYVYGKLAIPYPSTWTAKIQNVDLILTPPNATSTNDYIVFTSNQPNCAGTNTNCTLVTDASIGVADVLKTSSTNQATLGVFSQIKAGIKIAK